MSRLIDFSLASHGQPWTSTAAAWEQTAFNEQDAAAVIAQLGNAYNPSTVYILYGCELSSSAGTTTVTAGMLFTNGVFVKMNAASYADPVGPAVSIVNYVDTNGDGAGTTFADSFVANVLKNRNAVCLSGTSGSGAVGNYVDLVPMQQTNRVVAGSLNGSTVYFQQDSFYFYSVAATGAVSFTIDFTGARIGAEIVIDSFITASPTITIIDGGISSVVLSAPATLAGKTKLSYRMKYLGVVPGLAAFYTIESYAY